DALDNALRKNFWKILLSANVVKNILFAIAFSTKKGKTIKNSLDNPFESPYDHNLFENPYKS
ncbi:MAG: hypothetical protein J7497_04485, partial [Chitinophagaceae bacterium]|nr:hypothetical protein [Chitinophagaceae bacterium]